MTTLVEPRPVLGALRGDTQNLDHKRYTLIINDLYGSSLRQMQKAVKFTDRGFAVFVRSCHDNVTNSMSYVTGVGAGPVEAVKISDRLPKVRRSVATIISRSNSLPGASAAVCDPVNVVKIPGVDQNRGIGPRNLRGALRPTIGARASLKIA